MKSFKFSINGNKYAVDINSIEGKNVELEVNGTPYTVQMDNEAEVVQKTVKPVVKIAQPEPPKAAPKPVSVPQAPAAARSGYSIKSPLPGVVLDVFVRQGDTVKPGQRVLLLEAMKMENNIDADKEGVVKEIKVQRNDSVMEGDVLIIIEN
ncbi:MAG: biotin/lipoyl-binding protein [Bacteroidales bacterium]|jgi:biotin carboxyl carrier protein|nr:biotin/lipoyl-binding protein [Bacteroidales bacterium]